MCPATACFCENPASQIWHWYGFFLSCTVSTCIFRLVLFANFLPQVDHVVECFRTFKICFFLWSWIDELNFVFEIFCVIFFFSTVESFVSEFRSKSNCISVTFSKADSVIVFKSQFSEYFSDIVSVKYSSGFFINDFFSIS